MSIPFTQYLRPNGRRASIDIDMPEDVEALAHKFIEAGGRFEAEVLTTGHVSVTAVHEVDDEPQDIAIKVCANGPAVADAVEHVVRQADKWLGKDRAATMSDDSWKDGYDAWKLRSPYDDGGDEPDEGEWRAIETDGLLEEVRDLKATIARMQRDLDAAEKWARDYKTAHGPFEREPRIPDFMISF